MIKIGIFILLGSLFFIGCDSKPKLKKDDLIPVITVVLPHEQNSSQENELNGLVESPKTIQIKNRVDGFIEKQYFEDGSFVKQGTVLYKIDDRKLKNELISLEASYNQSVSNLANLEKTNIRLNKLIKVGGSTEQEIDNSNTLIEKEKSIISSFKAQIAKLKLDISFAIIKAPISGYVEKSQQSEGSYVQSGGTLLTQMYVANPLYFAVMLPSSEIKPQYGKINIGKDQWIGNFKYCDPMADSSGMVKCRYQFNPTSKIIIGSIGKFIFKDTIKKGLFIPQECLIQGPNGRSVYVIKNNKAYIKRIETASWIGTDIEVISGIKKDDLIAKTGIVNLKDNIEVKIKK